MCQEEDQIGPSLQHLGKPEGRGSQLLDKPSILKRCLLEPREVVPTVKAQELAQLLALSGRPSVSWSWPRQQESPVKICLKMGGVKIGSGDLAFTRPDKRNWKL